MTRSCTHLFPLPALLVAACHSAPPVPDLGTDPDFYRDVAYRTKLPGDRSAFVAPLADDRRADVLPAAEAGFPIAYDGDQRWRRPVAEMVDEVLRRQLRDSELFTELLPQAAHADLVVKPSLVTFAIGAMEMTAGARSLADVALRVQVFGPAQQGGERTLLLDEVYGDRQLTESRMVPPNRSRLAGAALRNTMLRLLQGLDGANVGRSGVPLDLPPPRR